MGTEPVRFAVPCPRGEGSAYLVPTRARELIHRAITVNSRTRTNRHRAAPQARSMPAWKGCVAPRYSWRGTEPWGSPWNVVTSRLDPNAVNISGAVSPIPRATASMDPVVSPGAAAGRTVYTIVCHLWAPSP